MGLKGDPGESISTPEVTVSPATRTVTENQTATFYCSGSGNPEPMVSWMKVRGSLAEERTKINENSGSLEIRGTTYNDSGQYICTAVSVLGKDSLEVTLLVEGGQDSCVTEIVQNFNGHHKYAIANNISSNCQMCLL